MIHRILLIAITITLFILVGCSNGQLNPVTPSGSIGSDTTVFEDASQPILISSYDENGEPNSGVATFGLYHGELNLQTLEASLTPIRTVSNGLNDSLVVDLTTFLTVSPCATCVNLKSVSLNADNNPVLNIGVSHPFQPGIQSLPPSATNRLDLHVFSVRGFIISDGIIGGGAKTFEKLGVSIPAWRLVNAFGWSNEFDEKWDMVYDTLSNLHPYVQHFTDYSFGNYARNNPYGFQNVGLPTGSTVMRMGAPMDYQDYVFKILPSTSETFTFTYAITASYGLSAKGKVQWLEPTYRVPLYCSKPATLVRVGAIDNKLDDINATSYAEITLQVLDISHGVAVGTEIDEMDHDSSVSKIVVEAPDLSDETFEFSDPASLLAGGNNRILSDPLRYKFKITNNKIAPVGNYIGLIKVVDAYPFDANVNLGAKNAIPAVTTFQDPTLHMFQIPEWATYTVFDYSVNLGNRPPTCELKLNKDEIFGGTSIIASPDTGTADPDGSIVLYEYDKDYDGETFNVDASNTTGAEVTLGPYINETGSMVEYTIAMRVTDNGTPGVSKICTKLLKVKHFSPVIFSDDFSTNTGWTFDTGNFWGIIDGFLASSGGSGAQMLGPGCYSDNLEGAERYVLSPQIVIDEIPEGYFSVRVTIVHAMATEIFLMNPFDFTDDCDLWFKPLTAGKEKLFTSGGTQYNTNPFTSKDGPSFAGVIGEIPAFGGTFDGKISWFDNPALAGKTIRLQFRQQTDDGIDNCRGGWWIDSVKVEYIK